MQVVVHLVLVGGDAHGALVGEGNDGFRQQPGGLQEVVGGNGHEHVQLEVALRSGHAHGHIVAHDLHGHHGDGLALGGVHLAGHDGGAGLVLGNVDLAQTVPGAGSQPAHVVGDLHHVAGGRLDGAVREHQLILGGQRVELVGGGDEILAGQLRYLRGHGFAEALGGVQAGADGGAAQRQFLQGLHGQLQQLRVPLQRGTPAADLLAELDGGCILQMGAAGLHDALVLRFQLLEGGHQMVDGGQQLILDGDHRGDVHRRGEGVVGGLAHVYVVVGVHQLLARQLVGAVGHHFVGVHVGLGAGTGLPHHQREVAVQLAGDHLVAGAGDDVGLFIGHLFRLELVVGQRGGLLQDAEGVDDLGGHGLDAHADFEVLVTALGLRGPEPVGGNLHLAHRVMFDAVFHGKNLLAAWKIRCPDC